MTAYLKRPAARVIVVLGVLSGSLVLAGAADAAPSVQKLEREVRTLDNEIDQLLAAMKKRKHRHHRKHHRRIDATGGQASSGGSTGSRIFSSGGGSSARKTATSGWRRHAVHKLIAEKRSDQRRIAQKVSTNRFQSFAGNQKIHRKHHKHKHHHHMKASKRQQKHRAFKVNHGKGTHAKGKLVKAKRGKK